MFHWVCWKNNTLFRSLVFTGCMILSWVCHCSPLIVWLSGIEGAKRLFESNLSGFQSIVMLQVWYFHFSGGVGCAPWASVDSRCDGCGGCQHGLSSLGRRQLHPGWGSCWFDSCWGCGGVLVQNDSGCRMELLSPSTRASRRRWRVERWLLVWSWDGMVTKWNLTKEMKFNLRDALLCLYLVIHGRAPKAQGRGSNFFQQGRPNFSKEGGGQGGTKRY